MIAFFAQREPHRVAMKHGARHLTYRLADQQLRTLQAGLLTARVTQRKLVGVAHSDPLVQTLLLLALQALGVATMPFLQPTDASIVRALGECDLIFCERPIDGLLVPYALITAEWLGAVVNHPVLPELVIRDKPAGQAINVFTTSGSMGMAKSVVFDAKSLNARISSRLWQYGLEQGSRLLATLPPSTSGTYFVMQALLRVGGTLVYFDEATSLADLADCSHAQMLPVLLHRLAASVASGTRPMRRIKIFAVGAKLNASTRTLADESLNAEVIDAYGTTETGWLAIFSGKVCGEVLPGVVVEIVDQHDQPLRYGETGQIRARSPEMALGYLNETLSKAVFRDGWYYTGDFGRMQDARCIELFGRQDAMMNFGGIKIAPEAIEEVLLARAIAVDVAVLSRANHEGMEQLVVACVAPRLSGIALDQALVSALGANLGVIKMLVVEQVPRNAAGKLMRAELRAMIDGLHAGLP
jgi:acyl-coenzyme A synthetase/AMP-(fatty) acid ligase